MKKQLKGNIVSLIDFLIIAGKLKNAIRFSAAEKIDGDSSADHSWRVALMVFSVAQALNLKLDVEKAMKIALVHDIAEGITGEIDFRDVYFGKITKAKKSKMEMKAIEKIRKLAPADLGKEIVELWENYEYSKSKEAKFVKALDKIETTLHLVDLGYKSYDLPELIVTYPDKAVSDFPELKGMLAEVKKRLKKEFVRGKINWKRSD